MLNNCVGHTMVMLGIRAHFIFTPQQLWNHLTGHTMLDRFRKMFVQLSFVPGFGGGDTQFVPMPQPAAKVAPDSEMKKAAAKKLADRQARSRSQNKVAASTASASSTLLDDDSESTGVLT
jgi:hypothetical protein